MEGVGRVECSGHKRLAVTAKSVVCSIHSSVTCSPIDGRTERRAAPEVAGLVQSNQSAIVTRQRMGSDALVSLLLSL